MVKENKVETSNGEVVGGFRDCGEIELSLGSGVIIGATLMFVEGCNWSSNGGSGDG